MSSSKSVTQTRSCLTDPAYTDNAHFNTVSLRCAKNLPIESVVNGFRKLQSRRSLDYVPVDTDSERLVDIGSAGVAADDYHARFRKLLPNQPGRLQPGQNGH